MTMQPPSHADNSISYLHAEDVVRLRSQLDPLFAELGKAMVGQQHVLNRLVIGLLVGGHVLLEGVPGLAKTLAARSLASCLQLDFHRIQFTPDLLPADIVGTQIYNPRSGEFTVKKGPIFANIVLADEINRAPAKVQSALLEAMQEGQVTIGETTHVLPKPFLVLATQNPLEHEGTYPLAEAQTDRFLMKVKLDYPNAEEEKAILQRQAKVASTTSIHAVIGKEVLHQLSSAIDRIYLDSKIETYVIQIVHATRRPTEFGIPIAQYIQNGASPRGTIALALAAKAFALLEGKHFVTPHHVKSIALDVLRHRLMLSYEAEAEEITADRLLQDILSHVPVP